MFARCGRCRRRTSASRSAEHPSSDRRDTAPRTSAPEQQTETWPAAFRATVGTSITMYRRSIPALAEHRRHRRWRAPQYVENGSRSDGGVPRRSDGVPHRAESRPDQLRGDGPSGPHHLATCVVEGLGNRSAPRTRWGWHRRHGAQTHGGRIDVHEMRKQLHAAEAIGQRVMHLHDQGRLAVLHVVDDGALPQRPRIGAGASSRRSEGRQRTSGGDVVLPLDHPLPEQRRDPAEPFQTMARAGVEGTRPAGPPARWSPAAPATTSARRIPACGHRRKWTSSAATRRANSRRLSPQPAVRRFVCGARSEGTVDPEVSRSAKNERAKKPCQSIASSDVSGPLHAA